MSFCQVCFDEAAYEEQNSCDCWLLTPRSALPAVTSGSHYSRHAWKRGSDQARDEEGLFFPLLRALCLALPGNTRGSESTSQECKLTSCRLCFSQERIGIRRYGGAGFTMARWCQGWQINVYININGEYLRPHQHRSKGTALFMLNWN